jgi:hypothetical protein
MRSRNPLRPLPAPTHEQTAALAHEIWRERGSPEGSDIDIWLEAERQLRGIPVGRDGVTDHIPAEPANVDTDSDPALEPRIDREIKGLGGRPGPRSITDYDV